MKKPRTTTRKNERQSGGRETLSRQTATEVGRFLAAPLGAKLLGQELRSDLYLQNGFRLLGLPASSNRKDVLSMAGRLLPMVRMSNKAVSRFAIDTGYCRQLEKGEIELSVSRLQDPRYRIVQEVFWPHICNGVFSTISESKRLTSPEIITRLEALTKQSGNQHESALAKHALALAYHNLALTNEIKSLTGESTWDAAPWEKALSSWAQVIATDSFWDYLRKRAQAFSDPRLHPDDIDQIRSELPSVILGFNLVLGRHYAQANDTELCRKHLDLIANAHLPSDVVNSCLAATVKTLVLMRLDPLVRRAEDPFKEKKGHKKGDRISRKEFDKIYHPIIDEAFVVLAYLTDELGLDPKLVALSEFDRICETILNAINSTIDYDNPNRERDILYSMLIAKQLLRLPLSTHTRRKIESSIRSDHHILYRGFELPGDIDVTECWFAEGEEADPDASLLFSYYKITQREVQVNVHRSTAGVSIRYESRRILVPRSARAHAVHSGKSFDKVPMRRKGRKESTLFSPPFDSPVPPFKLGRKKEANSILDVLEEFSKQWNRSKKYLDDGSLADWFEQRGQTALAQKLRACAQGKPDKKETLAFLYEAAAAEVTYVAQTATKEADASEKEKKAQAAGQKHAVEVERDTELLAFDDRSEDKKAKLEEQIQAEKAECESKCEQERKKLDIALKKERASAVILIKEAEERYASRMLGHQGILGVMRWQIPFGILGAGCGVAASRFMHFDFLNRIQVQGLSPENTPAIVGGIIGGVVLGGAGLLVATILKSMTCAMLKRPVTRLKRTIDKRCTRLEKANQDKIKKIESLYDSKLSPHESELQGISQDREAIIRKAEKKLEQIQDACDAVVQGFRDVCNQTKLEMEQRLAACCSVVVKEERASQTFPALKKAKSNGYKEGTEPSYSEKQMTYSEEEEARAQLRRAMIFGGGF